MRANEVPTPLVSVIMFCYNHENYIKAALNGVLSQTLADSFEIIVHDDASSDNSASIIKEYARYNNNIIPILQTENQYSKGTRGLLNIVIPKCHGKYIAFCECDDCWIDPQKVEKQVCYLESNPDCSAVYHNCVIVNKYGEPDQESAKRKRCFSMQEECDYTMDRYISTGIFPGQTATLVMRASILNTCSPIVKHLLSSRCNGDVQLLMLGFLAGRVHVLDSVSSVYRVVWDNDSWSARNTAIMKPLYNLYHNIDLRKLVKLNKMKIHNEWSLFWACINVLINTRMSESWTLKGYSALMKQEIGPAWMIRIPIYGFIGLPRMLKKHLGYCFVGRPALAWEDGASFAKRMNRYTR